MGLLYGRAGRLNTENGGLRPGQMFGAKSAFQLLVNAQLLAKASTKSYTATTAFGTVIFTVQTVGLVIADSFQIELQAGAGRRGRVRR